MYGMTNYGKLFSDEITEWLFEEGSIQSKCQMFIYYKYAPYGSNIFVSSYVYYCVYWYTSEAIGKWFVDTLGNRFHVYFLGYAHWFMSIIISHPFLCIRLYMLPLLLQNNWILPQLSQV